MTHPLQQISFNNKSQASVIEASAGTGKTWTIERLYIKALLEASLDDSGVAAIGVENILVVTFTNDATNELKQRISEQISQTINILLYLRNAGSLEKTDLFIDYLVSRKEFGNIDKDITLLVRALQNFDNSAIFTIHGFCNRVLQDYQFECGVSAFFELSVGRQELISKLVRDFFRKNIFTNSELTDSLPLVLDNLRKMFDPKNSNNDKSVLELVEDKLPRDLFILANDEYQIKYQLDVDAVLEPLATELKKDSEESKLAKAQFLGTVIQYIHEHYRESLASSNAISYDELIQLVANSVAHSDTLSDTLYSKYPIAFIDEFQDTDDLQWQIFSTIYHLADNQSRGNVVVVGDPKQAIYSFRGADIDTYLSARDMIPNKLELTQNFRSHRNIIHFINQLFDLPNQNSTLENSYLGNGIDYVCVDAKGSSGVKLPDNNVMMNKFAEDGINKTLYSEEVQLVSIVGKTAPERQDKLLNALAFEILALLNIDANLKGKIAILVEKNSQAKQVVDFLRQYGVKATELKLGNIFATTTASSLYKILLSCSDLGVRRNFIAALATPLFNISLERLFVDSDEANPLFEYWQQRFFNYKQIWQQKSIVSLVYHLLEDIIAWQQIDSPESKAQNIFTNRELASLYQLAELLQKQAQRTQNQAELMFWFKEKISNADKLQSEDIDGNNEELIRLDNDDEQIIITTQHKSKGLEYEILFCPFFKSTIKLDGDYDFNYRRPFFNSYRDDGAKHSAMINDTQLGEKIVAQANKETNRLNYVALTRAKSRIYIYLQNVTPTKNGYHSAARPSKVYDLFGFNVKDNSDTSHPLFNYPEFFSNNPMNALKRPHEFKGVAVYRRDDISKAELIKLRLNSDETQTQTTSLSTLTRDLSMIPVFTRQSYSGITHDGANDDLSDWYVKAEKIIEEPIEYRFSVLNDAKLKGATFGTLFHSLCENYPFTLIQLSDCLIKNNVDIIANEAYIDEFRQMLDVTFNYPLFDNISLNTIQHKQHELEFNLIINDNVNLPNSLSKVLAKHYGETHPFTQASKTLNYVKQGFLIGFIDLFFEHDGKYWVLDYKTNKLNDYTKATIESNGEIIESMSEHHYYLQYLLYLVAIKRYLETQLKITDATGLLGGAVYFYVRGAFTCDVAEYDGVFIDTRCQSIVHELDELLKGSTNAN